MENQMRHLRILLAVASFALFSSLPAAAGDVKIIANLSVKADAVSVAELRGVFMAETNELRDGSHVEPVFLRSGPTHEAFLRDLLKESSESLKYHYGAMVFTGKASMPKSFSSDADVLTYVAKTRGAIGYVSPSVAAEGVKVLDVFNDANSSKRALLRRVEPDYPETLRQLKITGTVRLKIIISPEGSVVLVTLLGGNPILGESAVKAVKQWTYAASPYRTSTEVTIRFPQSD